MWNKGYWLSYLINRRYTSMYIGLVFLLIAAVAMHVFILAMFGPLGLNWNNIIWPWTVAMAVIDILLFNTKQEFSWRDIVKDGIDAALTETALRAKHRG